MAQATSPLRIRIGQGYDIHPLVVGRPLIIGGVTIPADKGPQGHSDGDALYHALGDALLGAAALGDMGKFFSDEDPRWKDAASYLFLQEIHKRLKSRGWEIGNLDATIHLEKPKLAPHLPQMKKNLCSVLGLAESQVNLKAKRGEGLDAVGRGEAVAAQAVVLLV